MILHSSQSSSERVASTVVIFPEKSPVSFCRLISRPTSRNSDSSQSAPSCVCFIFIVITINQQSLRANPVEIERVANIVSTFMRRSLITLKSILLLLHCERITWLDWPFFLVVVAAVAVSVCSRVHRRFWS